MKKTCQPINVNLILFISFFLLGSTLYAQSSIGEKIKTFSDSPKQTENIKFASDIVVLDHEPVAMYAAVQKSDQTLYLTIADSLEGVGVTVVKLFKSTDYGDTWDYMTFVQYIGELKNLKMIRSGLDSIYCVFQYDDNIIVWNIEKSMSHYLGSGFRSFDAAATSSGSLYIIADSTLTNKIYRYASVDGGQSWPSWGVVIDDAAYPKIAKAETEDKLLLTFYHPLDAEIGNSALWVARYQESAPGSIGHYGFQEVVPSGEFKSEYKSAFNRDVIWVLYTVGRTGNINILGRTSLDGGVIYDGPYAVANNPLTDEYWFDIQSYKSPGGFDVCLYADSLQSGIADNYTDMLQYCYFSLGNFLSEKYKVSEHPPFWTYKNYKPQMVEFPFGSGVDCGVLWVGMDGVGAKLYWDRWYRTPVDVQENSVIPIQYELYNNYPNPFNPSTIISYDLSRNSNVSIKVYDILGREVAALINEYKTAGRYKFIFDTRKYSLSSGIYYYRMQAENFTETKKLVILK